MKKTITLTYLEKHLCYIAKHLSGIITFRVFPMMSQIREKLKELGEDRTPDSPVEITVPIEDFLMVYFELGVKPEGKMAKINREMRLQIEPQLTNKITVLTLPDATAEQLTEGAAALEIAQAIQAQSDSYDQQNDTETEEGRALLLAA